jgi:squalene synthase HpnC
MVNGSVNRGDTALDDARLSAAYAACAKAAFGHYENFPVASVLLPREMRPHVAAVYAFARAADDFADEGALAPEERLRLLDSWQRRLRAAVDAETEGPPASTGEPQHAPAVFWALGHTMRRHRLPVAFFEDLLSAFRQDVTVARYSSWPELLEYCRRSANPVGRLVLRIAGYHDARLDAWSDAICTALQLTNFWQDLKVDFDRGRVYMPLEELGAHGADASDLAGGRMTAAWHRALGAAVARTRNLFVSGRPLCDVVAGRLRYELRATWLGGMRVLDRAMRDDGAIIARPRLGALDAPWFAWRLATWALR